MPSIRQLALAALTVALLIAVAPTDVAAGGSTLLTVDKVIVGEAPADAEFTVTVSCGQTGDFAFTPNDLGPKSQFVNVGSTCDIVETTTAGAESVTYTCGFTPDASMGGTVESCTAGADGVHVVFGDGLEDSDIEVTITNTFPEPDAAPAGAEAIPATPTFTG